MMKKLSMICATAAVCAGIMTPSVANALPVGAPAEPPAGAQQLVTFGDSFTASSGNFEGNKEANHEDGYNWKPICGKDTRNWAHKVAADNNKTLADWSCNGTGMVAPLGEVYSYVQQAISKGNIGPGTEKVVLMYGGLDNAQWAEAAAKTAGVDIPKPEDFKDTLSAISAEVSNKLGDLSKSTPQLQEAAAKANEALNGSNVEQSLDSDSFYSALFAQIKSDVEKAAPGADVVLSGYPEFVSQDDKLCVASVSPNNPVPVTIPNSSKIQDTLRDSMKAAAEDNGIQFVDMLEETRGHNTCATNPEDRWTVGAKDDFAPATLPFHPSVEGEKNMGEIMSRHLYGDKRQNTPVTKKVVVKKIVTRTTDDAPRPSKDLTTS